MMRNALDVFSINCGALSFVRIASGYPSSELKEVGGVRSERALVVEEGSEQGFSVAHAFQISLRADFMVRLKFCRLVLLPLSVHRRLLPEEKKATGVHWLSHLFPLEKAERSGIRNEEQLQMRIHAVALAKPPVAPAKPLRDARRENLSDVNVRLKGLCLLLPRSMGVSVVRLCKSMLARSVQVEAV